jgi:hypothetical protein
MNKSLERLRTDYIDLYQLQRPNCTVPVEETMGAMEAIYGEYIRLLKARSGALFPRVRVTRRRMLMGDVRQASIKRRSSQSSIYKAPGFEPHKRIP